MEDLQSFKGVFGKIFGHKQEEYLMLNSTQDDATQQLDLENVVNQQVSKPYQPDEIDHKVTAYFGENLDELKQNLSGDKTQHEVLREYAQFFKPYNESQEMCNSAFRKYYDRQQTMLCIRFVRYIQYQSIFSNIQV